MGSDDMEGRVNFKYHNRVKKLIDILGEDFTDIYLRLRIIIMDKDAALTREKLYETQESMKVQNNTDERRHLEYSCEENKVLLDNLLKELKEAKDMHIYYKEYIMNRPSQDKRVK